MYWCEVYNKARMVGEPCSDFFTMMRTDIVAYEVNSVDVVVPVYSYPLECLTFNSLPPILTLDRSAHFLALAHEDIFHAIRLLSADHLHGLALPIWHIPAPRKHRVAASARRL